MDAASLKVASTGTIHVKNAAGEPLYDGEKPVRIIVHSPGSRAFSTVEARRTARTLRRLNDNDGKVTAPTAEEAQAETAEDLAAVTIAFENLSYGDKQGTDLFEAVYRDPELGYITKQVNRFLGDWSNFRAGSATS
jgi:hypothetical protein